MPDFSPEPAFLRARTRRQAMEWSLVLLSQGLESQVVREPQGWGLHLPPDQWAQARDILTLYQRENRHWFRYFRPIPDGPSFHPGALLWGLLIAGIYLAAALSPGSLRDQGVTDTARVLQGEVWRLWTSVSLHADLRHLMGNLTFGVLLLGLAMARFGAGWAQCAALLGGVAGNAVSAAVHGLGHRGLGASGMVMAALGMLAAGSFQPGQGGVRFRAWLLRGAAAAVLLFVLIGLDPGSDVVAHVAGFAVGCVAGVLLGSMPDRLRTSSRANHLAALLALAMFLAAWSAALN